MANNKVQLANGTVLLDLTGDTVTPETLIQGCTAHDKAGNAIIGTITVPGTDDATAISSQLKKDETAYVRGAKITGTAQMVYNPITEELTVPDWMVTING